MGAAQNGFQYSEEQISDRKIIRQRAEQNYICTTNVACIEHVVKGAGRSTPTGCVWKT